MSKSMAGLLGIPVLLTLLGGGWLYGQLLQVRQQLALEQGHHQQQLAELNDRLVALSRQHAAEPAVAQDVLPRALDYQLDQQVLATRLALVQQAINQKQFSYADQLMALQQQQLAAPQTTVAPETLRQLLLPLLARDRQRLQQWVIQKNSHDLLLDNRLAQLQQRLDLLARQTPRLASPPSEDGVWSRLRGLVQIEPANPQASQRMALRALSCREAALTLGLVRQAVATDPERLAVLLAEADRQLAALPEPAAQAVRAQLRALSSLPPPVWGGLESARFLQGDR